jgi:hypothetical protein
MISVSNLIRATTVLTGLLAVAPHPAPTLAIAHVKDTFVAHVDGAVPGFLGAVVISDVSTLSLYAPGVPALLTNGIVIGLGTAKNGSLDIVTPSGPVPPALLMIYAQAVTLDATGFASSKVESLILGT